MARQTAAMTKLRKEGQALKGKTVVPTASPAAARDDSESDRLEREALRGVESIHDIEAAPALPDAPIAIPRVAAERQPVLVPLSGLKLCEGNVRRGSKGDLEQLAADILAHGQLQNMTGEQCEDGTVAILAGGRRLRAMQLLVKRKQWQADRLVSVVVLPPGEVAREAGLAENFQRLALSPADEARAFAAVVAANPDSPASDEDVARRFGVTVRHVRQRLRLAGLAPVVLDALAKGRITLDIAQAFASVPDVEHQALVFAGASEWELTSGADTIRRRMQSQGTEGDDGLALFVGRDAYLAAGGRIEADLFADAQDELWLDTKLLEQLARPKLTEAAALQQARHGFAQVVVELHRGELWEVAKALDAGTVGLPFGTDWTQQPADARARFIVGIEIDDAGGIKFGGQAYLTPGGAPSVFVPAPIAGPDDEDGGDEDATAPEVFGGGAPTGAEKGLSGALLDALAMRRRDGLALALLQPDAAGEAAALLVFFALEAVMNNGAADQRATSIASAYNDRAEPVTVNPLPWAGDALDIALQQARVEGLDAAWQDGRMPIDRWRVFREQPVEQIERWAGVAAALSLKAWGENSGRRTAAVHREVAGTLNASDLLAQHWRPTAANYFDRCGKAGAMAFLVEVFGAADGPEPFEKLKRVDLSAVCERIAAGDASDVCDVLKAPADSPVVARIMARAKAWLPAAMMWGAGK